MAIDKSKWNTNIKVSQKTIDEIKKMGMAKALKTVAGSSAAASKIGDASAREWTEGVKRLYTAKRVNAAMNKTNRPKGATGFKPTYSGPTKPKGAYTKGSTKSEPKKNNLVETGKKVALTAAAVGAIAATRGRGGAIAARLAPGLSKSGVGKAILGNAPKTYPKVSDGVRVGAKGSFGKTTSAAAKAAAKGAGKKVGTKAEFANKATEDAVRKALTARAARVKSEGVTVGPKGTFGKTTAKSVAKKSTTKTLPKKIGKNYGRYGAEDEWLFEMNAKIPTSKVKQTISVPKKSTKTFGQISKSVAVNTKGKK
jgi:hypothetical protein